MAGHLSAHGKEGINSLFFLFVAAFVLAGKLSLSQLTVFLTVALLILCADPSGAAEFGLNRDTLLCLHSLLADLKAG